MGVLSRIPRRAALLAGGSVASAVAVCVVVAIVAGELGTAFVAAVAGVVLLLGGLVAGFGAISTVGLAVVLVAAVGAIGAAADGGPVRSESILVGLFVWLAFELACRSFEVRPEVTPSPDARAAWLVDLGLVGAVSTLAGGLALMLVDIGPVGGVGLRLGAMAVVIATVTGVWLLARGKRLR